jgi:uncharacterized protein YndB with AHSA1/START domain
MAVAGKGTAVVSLPSETQIQIVREFGAPAHLVFRAFTEPELVMRWWHANRGVATVAEIDLRVGGQWRWVMVTHDGAEVAFHGEYREIVPGRRLAYTEIYEVPGAGDTPAVLNTYDFEAVAGGTRLTSITDCPSVEVRDAILQSGMEGGLQDAYDLLEEVASALQ